MLIFWKYQKVSGPHETPSRVTCCPRAVCLRPGCYDVQNSMSEKEALLPTKHIFATNTPSN